MDLKAKPFHLNDEQIKWVEDTLASLSTREKVGQLFCINVVTEGVDDLVAELKKLDIQPGSYMTRSMPAKQCRKISASCKHMLSSRCFSPPTWSAARTVCATKAPASAPKWK